MVGDIFFFISVALLYEAKIHKTRFIRRFLNILILIITFPLLTYLHLQYISEYIPEMYYKNNLRELLARLLFQQKN